MHFYLVNSVTLTGLTSATLYIKAESSRTVTTLFCVICVGVQCPDVTENSGVGCRIAPWCSANRTLVDLNYLVKIFYALNPCVLTAFALCTVQLLGKFFVEDFVYKGAFSASGNTCYANKFTKRNCYINIFQVILLCTDNFKKFSVALSPTLRHFNLPFT